jgi:hypothetical protein
VPAAPLVTLAIVGFCAVDVNPFGPVQLYVSPGLPVAVRCRVLPAQRGESLPAVVSAPAVTVAATVPAGDGPQPLES